LAGDKLLKDVRNWLSAPDPWENHNIARESGCHGTAEWFIQDNTFSEWKASDLGSLLWIHGKRLLSPAFTCFQRLTVFPLLLAGAGKTVLWYI
jgi:hypothetical protein